MTLSFTYMVGLTKLHILTKNHINWCKGVEMVAVKQNPAQLTPVSPTCELLQKLKYNFCTMSKSVRTKLDTVNKY